MNTVTAWLFILSVHGTSTRVGYALLAPAARYASLRFFALPRPTRLFATPAMWRALQSELAVGLAPAPIDRQHPVARFLVNGDAVTVQYLTQTPIDDEDPFGVAASLDGLLMKQPA